jgi:hypothetical protein
MTSLTIHEAYKNAKSLKIRLKEGRIDTYVLCVFSEKDRLTILKGRLHFSLTRYYPYLHPPTQIQTN